MSYCVFEPRATGAFDSYGLDFTGELRVGLTQRAQQAWSTNAYCGEVASPCSTHDVSSRLYSNAESRVDAFARCGTGYSSPEKAFYGVVPYNTQTLHYQSAMGQFDVSRLPQTPVLDAIQMGQSNPLMYGEVSLKDTLSTLYPKIGSIQMGHRDLGTCTLVAENVVLVARHAIQDLPIDQMGVNFGLVESNGTLIRSGYANFDHVIESSIACDYALIALDRPIGEDLGTVPMRATSQPLSPPALLHYPLEKSLQVSVHTFDQSPYYSRRVATFHDSDYLSSGGAYVDPSGALIGIHLGSEFSRTQMNLMRYAVTLQEVVETHPHSLLASLARGDRSQDDSYTNARSRQVYLQPAPHNYLVDEEGYESEKILRRLLKNVLKRDKKIKLTKQNKISFSKKNLDYIKGKYKSIFDRFVSECTGLSGLHKKTRQYSVKYVIESDHTIPHQVWKSTVNPKMQALVTGGGKRAGENEMPALTIPYDIHRPLRTTGSSAASVSFRKQLKTLCDQNKIAKALILCYREYEKWGLDLQQWKKPISKSLTDHVRLGLITSRERSAILGQL